MVEANVIDGFNSMLSGNIEFTGVCGDIVDQN